MIVSNLDVSTLKTMSVVRIAHIADVKTFNSEIYLHR